MFNDFKGYDEKGNKVEISIPPTLLISAIGVMPDFYKTVSPEFKNAGDLIYLLGETKDELGASEYYKMLGAIGNDVPKVNIEKNMNTYLALEKAIRQELVASSISVTSGGLGIALAKASLGGMLGCKINAGSMPGGSNSAMVKLFSESQGRILVSVAPKNKATFEELIKDTSFTKLGIVSKDSKFIITDGRKKIVDSSVKKLYGIYHKFSNSIQ